MLKFVKLNSITWGKKVFQRIITSTSNLKSNKDILKIKKIYQIT